MLYIPDYRKSPDNNVEFQRTLRRVDATKRIRSVAMDCNLQPNSMFADAISRGALDNWHNLELVFLVVKQEGRTRVRGRPFVFKIVGEDFFPHWDRESRRTLMKLVRIQLTRGEMEMTPRIEYVRQIFY
jgi:hypothetical protein